MEVGAAAVAAEVVAVAAAEKRPPRRLALLKPVQRGHHVGRVVGLPQRDHQSALDAHHSALGAHHSALPQRDHRVCAAAGTATERQARPRGRAHRSADLHATFSRSPDADQPPCVVCTRCGEMCPRSSQRGSASQGERRSALQPVALCAATAQRKPSRQLHVAAAVAVPRLYWYRCPRMANARVSMAPTTAPRASVARAAAEMAPRWLRDGSEMAPRLPHAPVAECDSARPLPGRPPQRPRRGHHLGPRSAGLSRRYRPARMHLVLPHMHRVLPRMHRVLPRMHLVLPRRLHGSQGRGRPRCTSV